MMPYTKNEQKILRFLEQQGCGAAPTLQICALTNLSIRECTDALDMLIVKDRVKVFRRNGKATIPRDDNLADEVVVLRLGNPLRKSDIIYLTIILAGLIYFWWRHS